MADSYAPRLVPNPPTDNGSSTWGPFFYCPFLWWGSKLGGLSTRGGAFSYGSVFHQVEAQHYARVKARQEKTDPEVWTHPLDAPAQGFREGSLTPIPDAETAEILACYQHIHNPDQASGPKILAVEEIFEIDFGVNLDVPGHPKHGQPITYGPRVDLVQADKSGVYMVDHKTTSEWGHNLILGYASSLQFILLAVIGKAYYGKDFKGIQLHLLGKNGTRRHEWERMPIPAFTIDYAPELFVEAAHRKARYELAIQQGELDPWKLPRALSNDVCNGRYGLCKLYNPCHEGPGKR